MNSELIIVGGGLGGLVSGIILAKEGYSVCILEKNHQAGGNLQSFTRDGHKFSTGLHYIGSMDEGQTLHRLFKYIGIAGKIPLKKMDDTGYERITVGDDDTVYRHAMGWENFSQTLIRQFPEEREAISHYVDNISEAIKGIPLYHLENAFSYNMDPHQLNRCTMAFLRSLTKDERLQSILAGANSIYHGAAMRTPFYLHACIRNSFVNSAWRINSGSDKLAGALLEAFTDAGGTIITDAQVDRFEFDGDKISAALLKDGRRFAGKHFISNLHPAATMQLIPHDRIRRVFRQRIESMENTAGFFTLYLVFKKDFFPYLNYNHFHYFSDDYFRDLLPDDQWPQTYLVYTPFYEENPGFTPTASILSFMKYDEYKQWDGLAPDQRGQGYYDFREMAAQRLLNAVEKRYPGIRNGIEKHYVSTPLTFTDFTGTAHGSGYGVLKDCENPARSIILPRTKIPNLFFTGQNLNIHGVLGTTINAVITCAEFTGFRYLVNKIIHV
ncbi:MAG: FAD-dependent oxidoreductase [Bacteroidales bacterium]